MARPRQEPLDNSITPEYLAKILDAGLVVDEVRNITKGGLPGRGKVRKRPTYLAHLFAKKLITHTEFVTGDSFCDLFIKCGIIQIPTTQWEYMSRGPDDGSGLERRLLFRDELRQCYRATPKVLWPVLGYFVVGDIYPISAATIGRFYATGPAVSQDRMSATGVDYSRMALAHLCEHRGRAHGMSQKIAFVAEKIEKEVLTDQGRFVNKLVQERSHVTKAAERRA